MYQIMRRESRVDPWYDLLEPLRYRLLLQGLAYVIPDVLPHQQAVHDFEAIDKAYAREGLSV